MRLRGDGCETGGVDAADFKGIRSDITSRFTPYAVAAIVAMSVTDATLASANHDRMVPQPGWEEQARWLAVETPYYALTGKDGRFKITGVPPGTYKMVVWHPYIGGVKELTVAIQPKGQTKADMKIHAPTGRLYANQMVEHPYARYEVTDAARSQIVPTLIQQ